MHYMTRTALLVGLFVVTVSACTGSSPEREELTEYTLRMQTWFSNEDIAARAGEKEQLLQRLERVEPPRSLVSAHFDLSTSYAAYALSYELVGWLTERDKRREELLSDEIPGCSIDPEYGPRWSSGTSEELKLACYSRQAALMAFFQSQIRWGDALARTCDVDRLGSYPEDAIEECLEDN